MGGTILPSKASPSMAEILEKVQVTIKTTVDEKLAAFAAMFFKESREATKVIADRIDAVTDAVLGSCEETGIRSDASNVRMPASHAALIDRCRRDRPAVCAVLRESASNVAFARPLEQRAALDAALTAIGAKSGR